MRWLKLSPVTPGARKRKESIWRPDPEMICGNSWTSVSCIVVLTRGSSLWRAISEAVTSTVSVTAPSVKEAFAVDCVPACTLTLFCTNDLNPAFSTLTV